MHHASCNGGRGLVSLTVVKKHPRPARHRLERAAEAPGRPGGAASWHDGARGCGRGRGRGRGRGCVCVCVRVRVCGCGGRRGPGAAARPRRAGRRLKLPCGGGGALLQALLDPCEVLGWCGGGDGPGRDGAGLPLPHVLAEAALEALPGARDPLLAALEAFRFGLVAAHAAHAALAAAYRKDGALVSRRAGWTTARCAGLAVVSLGQRHG
ncbi:hypothetical protein UVI_02010940 [Ustilaginoidea virens]|uniref:Uncharacterized protein n=1 Tax=Ustilaginoidea virens TaxID=1159556 RepID=A0A1B5L0K1_USTVR|nr:hypothetical protein UVI_02010940 [Ustilaginoidea virens]